VACFGVLENLKRTNNSWLFSFKAILLLLVTELVGIAQIQKAHAFKYKHAPKVIVIHF